MDETLCGGGLRLCGPIRLRCRTWLEGSHHCLGGCGTHPELASKLCACPRPFSGFDGALELEKPSKVALLPRGKAIGYGPLVGEWVLVALAPEMAMRATPWIFGDKLPPTRPSCVDSGANTGCR